MVKDCPRAPKETPAPRRLKRATKPVTTFRASWTSPCGACDELIYRDDLAKYGQWGEAVHAPHCPVPKPTKFEGTTLDELGY